MDFKGRGLDAHVPGIQWIIYIYSWGGYTCVEFNLSILKISDDDGPSMITNSIKLRFTITNEELVLLNLTP